MNPEKNKIDIQLKNRSTILRLLQAHEYACRKDLAELSGLTAAAVTNLVRDLVDIGLVAEDRNYVGPRSRNAISLRINRDAFLVIGANFRRGRLACAVSNLGGKIIEKESVEFASDVTVEHVLQEICNVVTKMLSSDSLARKVIGMGIGVPGPINVSRGQIAHITNLPGWKQVPIRRLMEERFQIPVLIEHDANTAALAEKWFGVGKPYHDIVSLLVGKGVGAGIIANDKIYHGAAGFAGEIGHTSIDFDGFSCECGNRGCLELYTSTLVLLNRVKKELAIDSHLTIDQLRQVLDGGNDKAYAILMEIATYLGYGVVNIINSYNPEIVILGGEISLLGDRWLERIMNRVREIVDTRVLPDVARDVQIEYSRLGNDSVLLGAVALVVDYLFDRPVLGYFDRSLARQPAR